MRSESFLIRLYKEGEKMIKSFKELEIYIKSKEIVKRVYQITEKYPEREKYNIISQLRRSVLSIPLNIAEGYGRQSKEEFKRFLRISLGSSNEVEAIIEISKELNYITEKEYEEISKRNEEIGKMIYKAIEKWK